MTSYYEVLTNVLPLLRTRYVTDDIHFAGYARQHILVVGSLGERPPDRFGQWYSFALPEPSEQFEDVPVEVPLGAVDNHQ